MPLWWWLLLLVFLGLAGGYVYWKCVVKRAGGRAGALPRERQAVVVIVPEVAVLRIVGRTRRHPSGGEGCPLSRITLWPGT